MVRKTLVVTLTLGCLSMATWALAEDAPKSPVITDPIYTKPIRLVDVGNGRRINLYCRGKGSPTVIFDSGLSDWTAAWALVQPTISKKNATCSYDRAGLGFSDAATRPSTASNDVDDIHKALQFAHIKPPYVLVGHSAAGMAVRVFADRYRDEVVGMVIVDGSHEDQSSRMKAIANPDVQAHWDDGSKDTTCVDAAKGGEIAKDSPVYKKCVGEPYDLYSQAINDVVLDYSAKLKYQAAVASERQSFYGVSGDQTRATRRDFGGMPIIVLTRAPQPPGKDVTQQEQDQRTVAWEQMHNEVAAMSTHGVNEIVPRAGHLIQYDRPEVVIDAIRQALAIAAEQAVQPAVPATK
jgi:pimeloyl-ACP methyl ester carboxylesterase